MQDCHCYFNFEFKKSLCCRIFFSLIPVWFKLILKAIHSKSEGLKFLLHHEKNSWIENYKFYECLHYKFYEHFTLQVLNDIKKLEPFLQSSMILTPCLYNPKIDSAPSTWSFLLAPWYLIKGKKKCIKKINPHHHLNHPNFKSSKKREVNIFFLLL